MNADISNFQKQMPKLKVCGLTQFEQISELICAHVDFLGFIFYEKSPRFVLNHLTEQDIKSFPHTGKVGVFVNDPIQKIVSYTEKAGLNLVQLHGDENDLYIKELRQNLNPKIEIIKVIRIGNQSIEEIQSRIELSKQNATYFLFDTDSISYGGTGKSFDWNWLNLLTIDSPYFLSGGLSDDNIEKVFLLKQLPFALDINSKFESKPGIKDIQKIINFKNRIPYSGKNIRH